MIPIFVVDRPISLEILEGLVDYKDKFGILSHPFTSKNFKEKFRNFNITKYKIGDSGIFQKKDIDYKDLFQEYVKMRVSHGIIKDYYRDPNKTLESARLAIKEYKENGYERYFKLIGVAQGNSPIEYLKNYTQQKELGFEMVAIGGLLEKIEKHSRLVKVKQEELIIRTLELIRNKYPKDDLFPLGIFNRSRIDLFKNLDIWGSDYKGWIFHYDIERSHRKGDRKEQIREYLKNEIFPMINKDRLLILSCSEKKRNIKGQAIEVYDGPAFRILRNYLKDNDNLDVKIISAKYGLINMGTVIEPYDEKMTLKKALEYKKKYSREIKILTNSYKEVMFYGGSLYRLVLGTNNYDYTYGKIGQQLAQLRDWIYRVRN